MRLLLRLARHAGGDAVRDPLAFARSMSASVFKLWEAFERLEPSGRAEEWTRSAMVCASVYNANPFRSANSPAVPLRRFMPADLVPEKPADEAAKSQRERVALAVAALGGAYAVYDAAGNPIDPSKLIERA